MIEILKHGVEMGIAVVVGFLIIEGAKSLVRDVIDEYWPDEDEEVPHE